MTALFQCFACKAFRPIEDGAEKRCPACGSANGEVLTKERLDEGLRSGAIYNIDLKRPNAKRPKPESRTLTRTRSADETCCPARGLR